MRIPTVLTDLLDVSLPIIQAPMAGGGDTVELVTAVSNAGALGSIGAAYLSPEQIVERSKAVRAGTSRPFAINLFSPQPEVEVSRSAVQTAIQAIAPYYDELGIEVPKVSFSSQACFNDQLVAALESGASVFSFTFGLLPRTAVCEIKKRGMILMGTATTVQEARALIELPVDAVIAQGSESGGHRGTFDGDFAAGMIGTISLVPQVSDLKIPVIASGGIMDGRGIAAALALGASAVQLGTAFLTCHEAGVPDSYKKALLAGQANQTRITRAFSGRPARGLTNRFLAEMESRSETILPFPIQNSMTRLMRSEAARLDSPDYLSLWAGQGVGLARNISATDLIEQLHLETEHAINLFARCNSEGTTE